MKIFSYTILKTLELNELIINSSLVKTERLQLQDKIKILIQEKKSLEVLLDIAEHSVSLLK